MPLNEWPQFLNGPMFICYFIVILFYIERKWLLMRNLATFLPRKLHHFNAKNGSIKMLKNN